MNTNNFNINRLVNFLKRQASLNLFASTISSGAIFGVLLMISLLVAYFHPQNMGNMINLYTVAFFFSGFIFTSRVFSELNTPQKSYAFLTLPVSNLEKFVGSWLLSSPLFVIFYWTAILIIFLLAKLVSASPSLFISDLFTLDLLKQIGSYMVIQTIFFLGAASFKGYNFLKTLLALLVVAIGLGIFTGTIGSALFGGSIDGEDFSDGFKDFSENMVLQVLPKLFWYLLGPFLLLVSYFKLKEREV